MPCIFVLDLFNGAVVHAVRGKRSLYEPIDRFSRIVSSSDPIAVVKEIKPKEIYIADLNLLTGSGDNLAVIREISRLTKTMADIGASRISDLNRLAYDVSPVLGTETASLKLIEEASLHRDIVVSIDMKAGQVLARDAELSRQTSLDILARLNSLPLEAIILLDLSRVGTSLGLNREFLEMAVSISNHALILGGGVRDVDDLRTLEDMGFSGALVATAVHNGRIPLKMLR